MYAVDACTFALGDDPAMPRERSEDSAVRRASVSGSGVVRGDLFGIQIIHKSASV